MVRCLHPYSTVVQIKLLAYTEGEKYDRSICLVLCLESTYFSFVLVRVKGKCGMFICSILTSATSNIGTMLRSDNSTDEAQLFQSLVES